MNAMDIQKILVVGAGTMGQQIAFQCAANGYAVKLCDVSEDALAKAQVRIGEYAAFLVNSWHLDREMAEISLDSLVFSTDMAEAAKDADLVSESVFEDPAVKGRVFAELDRICPEHTIFTTNTSLLVPSMMAEATGRPDRFLALHFHQPAWTANLADIMPHPGTSPDVVALVREFALSIKQVPLVLNRENYGYVFNAMYSGLNSAALTLAANGVASVEDIDRSWMIVMKMPLGPFGMLDVVGLDTVWHVTDYWAGALGDPQTRINADYLKREFLDKGRLGIKNGRGFYDYPEPSYQSPDFLTSGCQSLS